MAGLGAAMNTGNVGRGDSVAVIGCGGVGDAAIAGAKLAGATTIIAIDRDPAKLDWAVGLGATHTINGAEVDDVVAAVQELTDGNGADVVVDAVVVRRRTSRRSTPATWPAPSCWWVPTPEMRLELPLVDFFSRGGALKSSWYGDCLPERDFPMLIDLYEQGSLPLDKFVTERIGINDVEAAFDAMKAGKVLRSVVEIR